LQISKTVMNLKRIWKYWLIKLKIWKLQISKTVMNLKRIWKYWLIKQFKEAIELLFWGLQNVSIESKN